MKIKMAWHSDMKQAQNSEGTDTAAKCVEELRRSF